MADYQLNQNGPTVQQAIDKALEIEQELQQEAHTREQADALLATKTELAAEAEARAAADALKAPSTALTEEVERAQGAEGALGGRITTIEGKVPSAASSSNQLADKAFVNTQLATKQDVISDLATIRSGAGAGATAYQKPGTGIPKTDLASDVRTTLDKADSAALLIPAAASPSNQLADKDFVNSSVATATATHQGTYNLVTDLGLTVSATQQQIATAIAAKMTALGRTPDNNDYVFVQVPTANDKPTEIARIDRYKYNGSAWGFEYSLNNSGFTAAQWAAINSGITSGLVSKLLALPTNSELSTLLNGKTDKDDDAVEGNLAKFDGNGNPVDAGYSAMRIHRDLGYNAAQTTVVLTAGETGKYVKCSTRSAEANANFNISAPFNVDACSELLIKTGYNPSDNEHAALDISVIAIYEEMERTRTVQAKDGNNNPLYYEVDEDGNPTSTQTTTVTPYPVYTTETYTESRYLPNNEDRFVQIPDSGYYVANIPQSCKCVISYKPGVTDLNVIVVKHGALANLTSQIFGIYEHRTMAEAVVSLALRLDALERRIVRPGNIEVGKIDAVDIMRYRQPVVLLATGAPNASLRPTNLPDDIPWDGIPAFIGQFYYAEWKDGANTIRRLYFSTNITAISDWHYVALT